MTNRSAITVLAPKSKAPGYFPEGAALHNRAIQRIRIEILDVPRRQQILSYDAELDELSHSPAQPAVQPRISRNASNRQFAHIPGGVIPFQMVWKVEQRPDLKLMVG